MAALPDLDRARIMGHLSRIAGPWTLTKPDIRAAVNALDDWIDTNASTINQQLPEPFRSEATLAQKGAILAFIAMRRGGLLTTAED